MLGILKKKANAEKLSVETVLADVRNFDLKRKYLPAIFPFQSIHELITRKDQMDALECIHSHLVSGGHLIVSVHNPGYHEAGRDEEVLLKEFSDPDNGHIIRVFNSRTARGHLATNDQVYREYDGRKVVSERKFVNMSYVFRKGEFEELLNKTGFVIDEVLGGYNYEPVMDRSRFLVYRLSSINGRTSFQHT